MLIRRPLDTCRIALASLSLLWISFGTALPCEMSPRSLRKTPMKCATEATRVTKASSMTVSSC